MPYIIKAPIIKPEVFETPIQFFILLKDGVTNKANMKAYILIIASTHVEWDKVNIYPPATSEYRVNDRGVNENK